ncbi:hypothetical protein [Paraburkholderia acidicola]|uniref:hypothetical protein n=1 Tax=Paraburkholderia acidicola TaxID=1912599 RepID=UPI0012FF9378|nr:hypothetical protein [Paraburkholderia acidicola]
MKSQDRVASKGSVWLSWAAAQQRRIKRAAVPPDWPAAVETLDVRINDSAGRG